MGKAKKQHYVPQFLLRNFAAGTKKNSRFWVLDKTSGEIRNSSVRDSAHENDFYEYCQGNIKIQLENLMQKIDAIGARIIAQIIDSGKLALSGKDRIWLSYFIACQMTRTPMTMNDMENFRQIIINKWGADIRLEGDIRTIGEYSLKDAKRSSLEFLQKDVPEFARLLQDKVWFLVESPSSTPFIISDNPVTRHNLVDRWPRGNLGLKNEGIEIYFPLSTRFSIHMACPKIAEILCMSSIPQRDYLSALETGQAIGILPENVVFTNSLQVIWAERFVFGKSKEDLDLAVDMLRTNPELKDGPGVRQRPADDE